MNYTQNYQLPQWEKTDRIMMDDFNDAMSKVEDGLGAIPRIITGSYTGNGEASQEINLGFRPKAVIVAARGGMNADRQGDCGVQIAYGSQSAYMVAITDTGFTVSGDTNLGMNSTYSQFNPYRYLAIR